jgi:hypothetical protein
VRRSAAPARAARGTADLGLETAVVDAALARLEAPAGWRVLRTRARLEAHWNGSGGRWARYSIRLHEPAAGEAGEAIMFRRTVGGAQLTVSFQSSDLAPETVDAASDLLTPLQHVLAHAELPPAGRR